MSYRDDLDALEHRHSALDAEVSRATRDRDALRSMIDTTKARLRLPVLDNIRVAAPCTESWDSMPGDDRARHCNRCNQNVYNLSDMAREEAQALLVSKEGRLCVRYFRRTDGTILSRNCPIGAARRRRRWAFGLGVVMTVLGTLFGFLSHRQKPEPLMGTIAAEPVQGQYETGGLAPPHDQGARIATPGNDRVR